MEIIDLCKCNIKSNKAGFDVVCTNASQIADSKHFSEIHTKDTIIWN